MKYSLFSLERTIFDYIMVNLILGLFWIFIIQLNNLNRNYSINIIHLTFCTKKSHSSVSLNVTFSFNISI